MGKDFATTFVRQHESLQRWWEQELSEGERERFEVALRHLEPWRTARLYSVFEWWLKRDEQLMFALVLHVAMLREKDAVTLLKVNADEIWRSNYTVRGAFWLSFYHRAVERRVRRTYKATALREQWNRRMRKPFPLTYEIVLRALVVYTTMGGVTYLVLSSLPGAIFGFLALLLLMHLINSVKTDPWSLYRLGGEKPRDDMSIFIGSDREWYLPAPSAAFSAYLCLESRETLGMVEERLRGILACGGYQCGTYPAKDGFVLLSALEKIDDHGRPSRERWRGPGRTAMSLSQLFSMSFVERLLDGEKGRFRFFLFGVAPTPFRFRNADVPLSEYEHLFAQASARLSSGPRDSSVFGPLLLEVLVYEFEMDHYGQTRFVHRSAHNGLTHLNRANITSSQVMPDFLSTVGCIKSGLIFHRSDSYGYMSDSFVRVP